jgi:hypothetical protein
MFHLAQWHHAYRARQCFRQHLEKHYWWGWQWIGCASRHNFHKILPYVDWISLCHFDTRMGSDSACCILWTLSMRVLHHNRCKSHISTLEASFTASKSSLFTDLQYRIHHPSKWHNLYGHTCSICKEWGDRLPWTLPSTCKGDMSITFVDCR